MLKLSDEELRENEAVLTAKIDRLLPDFGKSCRENSDVVIVHQDSFAADYQDEEFTLLGMAIKFAGLHGKEIRVVGKNRETLQASRTVGA
jgi:hypothetical protein